VPNPSRRRRPTAAKKLYSLLPVLLLAFPSCESNDILACISAAIGGTKSGSQSGWEAGATGTASNSTGGSQVGVGLRAHYLPGSTPLGLGMQLSKYFPEAGSAYGAWMGARLEIQSDGPVNWVGIAGPTLARSGYSPDGYEIPEGDFGDFGGGAPQQGVGLGSQNSYGLRLGVGATGNNPESKWRPFGEVGYDIFLGGADVENQLVFSGGVSYRLGGPDEERQNDN